MSRNETPNINMKWHEGNLETNYLQKKEKEMDRKRIHCNTDDDPHIYSTHTFYPKHYYEGFC